MQNAKDTFYEVLRNRLSERNPERTVTVRGVTRAAILVDENEAQNVPVLADCFHLRWLDAEIDDSSDWLRTVLRCEVFYETAGSSFNGGLDRGRALAAMDAELLGALELPPQNAPKWDYSALGTGGSARRMGTTIWWSVESVGEVKANRNRLGRSVIASVMSIAEPGEGA